MSRSRPSRIASLLAATTLALACNDSSGPDPAAVRRISIGGLADTLWSGARDTAEVIVRNGLDETVDAATVRWSSSDTTTLVVDSLTGIVAAREGGDAWVRASTGPHTDSARVRVDYPSTPTPAPFVAFDMPTEGNSQGLPTHCGLTAEGKAWCATSTQFATFTELAGGHVFRDLEGSQRATCALTTTDEMYCWGANHHANLGLGATTLTSTATPVLAAGGRTFSSLSLGGHAAVCGVGAADSLAWCWGHNDFWQVGRMPQTVFEPTPAPVPGLPKVRQVSAGSFNGCAIAVDGSAWCWGQGFAVRSGTTVTSALRQVAAAGVYAHIAAGNSYACGLEPTGTVECFAGDAPREPVTAAPPLVRLFNAAIADSWCGLTATGAAWCWRAGTSPIVAAPFRRTKSFRDLALGQLRTCGVATDGKFYC